MELAAHEQTLIERNLAIDACVSRSDAAALAEFLNEDFRYTHSKGLTQTKQEYVDFVAGSKDPALRRLIDTIVEIHDDVAITRGDADLVRDDQPFLFLRYVRVWRLVEGRWMAISQRTLPATDRIP